MMCANAFMNNISSVNPVLLIRLCEPEFHQIYCFHKLNPNQIYFGCVMKGTNSQMGLRILISISLKIYKTVTRKPLDLYMSLLFIVNS